MSWFRRRSPRQDLWLIVGLGNPGPEYAHNRHNVGFMVADCWAERHNIALRSKRPWALYGEGHADINNQSFRVLVAKPRTYMNLSGEAVSQLTRRYHIPTQRLVVVYDDLDLPLGRLRVRGRGSAGGHRGMASIIERLGTEEFARVRIGIGRPVEPVQDPADYVLSNFTASERNAAEGAIRTACDALDTILAHGVAAAMNRFNA